jgi:hypothetical protein
MMARGLGAGLQGMATFCTSVIDVERNEGEIKTD